MKSNKGRITRADQAWGPAHLENLERGRIVDIGEAYEQALTEYLARSEHGEGYDETMEHRTQVATVVAPQSPTLAEVIPATQSLAVPLKFINAALLTSGKDDIRYYLNGVYLHAVDGEIRICATDGHRLIVSRFMPEKDARIPQWAEDGLILPRGDLQQALPLLGKNAHMHTEPCVTIAQAPGSPAVSLRSTNGFATFALTPVEGKFPDYARVLASVGEVLARGEGEAMESAGINSLYLRGATDIAARLGAKAIHSFVGSKDQAAIFTFDGAPDTVLIIMAMRTGPSVSDGVVKLLGSGSINSSIGALRAHVTRTQNALADASTDREREELEARKTGLETRIAHLLQLTTEGPKRLEQREAA